MPGGQWHATSGRKWRSGGGGNISLPQALLTPLYTPSPPSEFNFCGFGYTNLLHLSRTAEDRDFISNCFILLTKEIGLHLSALPKAGSIADDKCFLVCTVLQHPNASRSHTVLREL